MLEGIFHRKSPYATGESLAHNILQYLNQKDF